MKYLFFICDLAIAAVLLAFVCVAAFASINWLESRYGPLKPIIMEQVK